MKGLLAALGLALFAGWDPSAHAAVVTALVGETVQVIANADRGPVTLDRAGLLAIYLMRVLQWPDGTHWGIWGEYHLIDGPATASTRDNTPPEPVDAHWSLLLLMAAYRF